MNETVKRVIGRPWQPGQSGNPAGRPLGSRHKITEAIIQDISGAWQTHGPQVLDRLAVEDPATFAKLAVGLVPKDVLLSINAKLPGGMDPDDWQLVTEVMGAIKQSIPDANTRQPGEVLEHTLAALRAYSAKPVIEGEQP